MQWDQDLLNPHNDIVTAKAFQHYLSSRPFARWCLYTRSSFKSLRGHWNVLLPSAESILSKAGKVGLPPPSSWFPQGCEPPTPSPQPGLSHPGGREEATNGWIWEGPNLTLPSALLPPPFWAAEQLDALSLCHLLWSLTTHEVHGEFVYF